MPGMSPNKKAAKGVFGPGGAVPQISMVTPPSGTVVTTAVGFAATAVAVDDVDGDISASLTWTSDLDGVAGAPGGATTLTLTTLGDHVITVEATATTGGATNSVPLLVTVVAP